MQRYTFQVGSFGVNCSFVEDGGRALVIDPGQEPDRILALLRDKGWEPAAVLLTHGHFDHVNAIPGLLRAVPGLPVYVAEADAAVLPHPLNACPPEYSPVCVPPSNLRPFAASGGRIGIPDFDMTVLPTPGHTPGCVCWYFEKEKLLFSGDTLFAGSVGRTDLPGGDMATLMHSLENLKSLPADTVVIPGHGGFTTIGRELAANPFLQ